MIPYFPLIGSRGLLISDNNSNGCWRLTLSRGPPLIILVRVTLPPMHEEYEYSSRLHLQAFLQRLHLQVSPQACTFWYHFWYVQDSRLDKCTCPAQACSYCFVYCRRMRQSRLGAALLYPRPYGSVIASVLCCAVQFESCVVNNKTRVRVRTVGGWSSRIRLVLHWLRKLV